MKLAHPELFNIELGIKVDNHLTAHPEQHNQTRVMERVPHRGLPRGLDQPDRRSQGVYRLELWDHGRRRASLGIDLGRG